MAQLRSPSLFSRFTFHRSRAPIFVFPFLLLLTLWAFFPPYKTAWVGDDYVQLDYIKDFVADPQYFYRFFNPYFIGWYYRPFQNIWLLVHRIFFGLNPFAYYWLQLGVHLLVVSLVYRVAKQFALRPFPALCAAALFAIHGHYVDVVGWISSIAIVAVAVWNLLALWVFLRYLKRPSLPMLLLTLIFCLLGLVTHEEWVLLPPALGLLLLINWQQPPPINKKGKQPPLRSSLLTSRFSRLTASPALLITFFILFALSAFYIYFQFTRTNLTIDLATTPSTHWTEYLAPLPISHFFVDTFIRFFLLAQYRPALMAYSYLLTYLMLLLLGVWYWQAGKIGRFGLLWVVIHLGLIYLALWTQKPHLYAGRHIYNAGLGLVFAIAEVIQRGMTGEERAVRSEEHTPRSSRFSLPSSLFPLLSSLVIIALLVAHIVITRQTQADWLAKAEEDANAARQMQVLMPTITADTHVFANRFPITPNFLRSVTQVWYDQFLSPPSGGIGALGEYGRANRNFYVFDYDNDKTLYNLMPELQQHQETIFVWSQPPEATILLADGSRETADPATYDEYIVAGAAGERRLAVRVQPANHNTVSLNYTLEVPAAAVLRFGVRQEIEETAEFTPLTFHLYISSANGEKELLWETTLSTTAEWEDATLPLERFAGQTVKIFLEISGGNGQMRGYWSNPRLTID